MWGTDTKKNKRGFTASQRSGFVDVFGKGLYFTPCTCDTSLKIFVSLAAFPPTQTPLTLSVVSSCHSQNRTIFSWLINFDQQKFSKAYKYQKMSTLLKPQGMLVLSKTHNLPGEVKHQPYFLLWWAGKAVVTIGMFWFQLCVWALLIPFSPSQHHQPTSPCRFGPRSPELVAWCPGTASESTPSLFGPVCATSGKHCLECNLWIYKRIW